MSLIKCIFSDAIKTRCKENKATFASTGIRLMQMSNSTFSLI